jgi:hypothetical protein
MFEAFTGLSELDAILVQKANVPTTVGSFLVALKGLVPHVLAASDPRWGTIDQYKQSAPESVREQI